MRTYCVDQLEMQTNTRVGDAEEADLILIPLIVSF